MTSALFVGDNGDGKSTVLRCLAMGLCDSSSASALFRELSGPIVRHAPDRPPPSAGAKGDIKIYLDSGDGSIYEIHTEIETVKNSEQVTQKLWKMDGDKPKEEVEQQEFPWDRVFVAAYGPGLRTNGTKDYPRYQAVDAVYPLFAYDQPLQNPELIIRRLIAAARGRARTAKDKDDAEHLILESIQVLMKELLRLDSPEDFLLTDTGLKVKGSWGVEGLSQLGDGFQSTITWVLDLISWWFLRESANQSSTWEIESIEGIVIIDEIEQHLHPKWQHRILHSLRETLPNIQFVVATHSPLVASSSKDVAVHQFREGQLLDPIQIYGWLPESVYRFMGLPDPRSIELQERTLHRYKELDLKKIEGTASQPEIEEWKGLNNFLITLLPEGDPIRLSLDVAGIVESLKAQREDTK